MPVNRLNDQMPMTTRISVAMAISSRPIANTMRMMRGVMKLSNDRKSDMAGSFPIAGSAA